METLDQLYEVLVSRKTSDPEVSYTARLLNNEDEILKKIGEEAIEVILAAKGQGDMRTTEEIADLCYHVMVLMVQMSITPGQIRQELQNRR